MFAGKLSVSLKPMRCWLSCSQNYWPLSTQGSVISCLPLFIPSSSRSVLIFNLLSLSTNNAAKDIMKDYMCSCLFFPNLTGYLLKLPKNLWVCTWTTKKLVLICFTFDLHLYEKDSSLTQDIGRFQSIWVHWQPHEGHLHFYKCVMWCEYGKQVWHSTMQHAKY